MLSFTMLAFAQAQGQPSAFMQLVPIVLIFGIFYFLLIAPMRKRQKALKQMISDVKKGDRIVTSGGLHGEVTAVLDKAVLLKVADNVKVKVSKSAIAGLQGSEGDG
ncbi:MAG: preprotein translocase subunit YajC [bacterium]|nr:preprotein translocase subunit YajC [bacterium]